MRKKMLSMALSAILLVTASGCGSTSKREAQYDADIRKASHVLVEHTVNAITAVDRITTDWERAFEECTTKNSSCQSGDWQQELKLRMKRHLDDILAVKKSKESVDKYMTAVQNPPEKYKAAYDVLMEMYTASDELYQMAMDPSGPLDEYSKRSRELVERILFERFTAVLPDSPSSQEPSVPSGSDEPNTGSEQEQSDSQELKCSTPSEISVRASSRSNGRSYDFEVLFPGGFDVDPAGVLIASKHWRFGLNSGGIKPPNTFVFSIVPTADPEDGGLDAPQPDPTPGTVEITLQDIKTPTGTDMTLHFTLQHLNQGFQLTRCW